MNPTKLPKTPTLPGQLGVSGNVVSTMVGTAVVPLCNGDAPSFSEVDASYFDSSIIPFTRIGDNSYLPMDVKADFRGAIQPWSQLPYFLVEDDGSVTGLRPGYNGEFIRIFYAYSPSGSFAAADMQLTDSEYRPLWLAADEYVSNVIDGHADGFCISVKSTSNLSATRYYWVDHNGTLDSRFHTFLDVTNNMTIVPNGYFASGPATGNGLTGGGSGMYIREAGLWVQSHTNQINMVCYTWYTVDRPFQTVRSSSIPAALPAKSVNWQDISNTVAGTSNTSVIFDGSSTANMAKYFKFLNEPSASFAVYATYPNSGRMTISYAFDAGVVRLFTPYVAYVPYASGATMFAWSTTMDYNVSANTLRYNPVTDDPQRFQTLPMVVKYADTSVDSGPVPGTITDAYKANKFPMQTNQTGLIWGNTINKILHANDLLVSMYVGTSTITGFSMGSSSINVYAGTTLAAKRMDSLRRPYFNKVGIPYTDFIPFDASILSKNLQFVRFIGPTLLHGRSTSRLYGQSLTSKPFKATLPSVETTSIVYSTDSNSYQNCLPTPTAVTGSSAIYDNLGMCTVVRSSGPMALNRASYTSIDTTASSWLAVNVSPSTGLAETSYAADPATFRSKMAEVVALMKTASTLKPTIATSQAVDLRVIWVDGATSSAYFLVSMVWGNYTDGFQFEYATIKLTLVGSTVVWPTTVSLISSISGTKMTGPGQSAQRADLIPEFGGLGIYQGADGRWFVLSAASTFIGTQGGNYSEVRMFTMSPTMSITASRLHNQPQSWLAYTVGVHPTFGLHYTTTWNDSNAKASMFFYDLRSTTDQTARLQASADNWVSGAGGLGSVFILSSKSAAGFVMYSSEIAVLMNGKVGTIPTQTIQLSSIVADPANKIFRFYVQWNGTQFVLVPSLTAIPESMTSTYVGSVVTNSTGISSSTISKVTRIDTFRVDGEAPIEGSSIRTYPK